jgi:uncharacterized membrane protein
MRRIIIVIGFWMPLLWCPSAHAELNFCNGSPLTIQTVVGESVGGAWQSRGWWTINPGDCVTVVGGDLKNRYYYAFAETPGSRWKWTGDASFCIRYGSAFTLGEGKCEAEEYRKFATVDTGQSNAFNYWFTCSGCLDQRLVNAVRINIPWLENLAHNAAPLSYRTNDWQDVGPADIQYGVSRSRFNISVDGNQVSISTRLSYWLSVSHTRLFGIRTGLGSCGVDEPEPIADVKLTTVFGITPEGKLASKTRTSLSFPTQCRVTMFNIDATGYVQQFAQPQLDRIAATIDSRIGEINVSRVLNAKDLY